jgi:hypothetical protein
MATVINQSGSCQLYVKGPKNASRYYVSEKGNSFRRKQVSTVVAATLATLAPFYFETDVMSILEDKTENYLEKEL